VTVGEEHKIDVSCEQGAEKNIWT